MLKASEFYTVYLVLNSILLLPGQLCQQSHIGWKYTNAILLQRSLGTSGFWDLCLLINSIFLIIKFLWWIEIEPSLESPVVTVWFNVLTQLFRITNNRPCQSKLKPKFEKLVENTKSSLLSLLGLSNVAIIQDWNFTIESHNGRLSILVSEVCLGTLSGRRLIQMKPLRIS